MTDSNGTRVVCQNRLPFVKEARHLTYEEMMTAPSDEDFDVILRDLRHAVLNMIDTLYETQSRTLKCQLQDFVGVLMSQEIIDWRDVVEEYTATRKRKVTA